MKRIKPKPLEYKISKTAQNITVITCYRPKAYSVHTNVLLRIGSASDSEPLKGLAHCLEHMIFRGSSKLDTNTFNNIIYSSGSTFNGSTSYEYTCFYLGTFPQFVRQNLKAFADIIVNPAFSSVALRKEKHIIFSEIDEWRNDAVAQAHSAWDRYRYGNHPFSLPILGCKDSVGSLTIEQLKQFHTKYYHGDNCVVSAAGNIKHRDFVRYVEEAFESINLAGKSQKVAKTPETKYLKHKVIPISGLQQDIVFAGHFAPGLSSGTAIFGLHFLSILLGSGSDSMLFKALRTKLGLVYSTYATYRGYNSHGEIELAAYCPTTNRKVTQAEMQKIIEQIQSKKCAERTITINKNRLLGAKLRGLDSLSSCCQKLAIYAAFDCLDFVNVDTEIIDAIDSNKVLELAQKYLSRLTWCTATPRISEGG